MNIGITTLGCDGGKSGIGRYAQNLLEQFSGFRDLHDFRVFGHDDECASFMQNTSGMNWNSVAPRWINPTASILWHQAKLPFLTRDLDVLFLPAGNRRLPLISAVPTVGTVHDLSSLHVEQKYDRVRDVYIKRVLPSLIRRLDHVLTVSDCTKQDIIRHCGVSPDSISVIPLAADSTRFYPENQDECLARLSLKYGLDRPFLLYISRIEHPGKNHIRLIKAFDDLKRREKIPHELVFVGPDKERAEEVHAAAAKSPNSDDIRFLGFVEDQDLRAFYNAAAVFVFPSLFEGFGLPILEAMSCGTPVACSNSSSLPEVAGNAAKVFDPFLERGMSDSIATLLNSHSERETLIERGLRRARGYTWQHTAQRTLLILFRIARQLPVRSTSTLAHLTSIEAASAFNLLNHK
jgi:glycosyltransferase involved in cell wall biosynthesis